MQSMNLRLNLMKWASLLLAMAAVACDDDKKKHFRAAKRLRVNEPVLFFPMIMQVDGNISLLRKEIL